MKMVTLKFTICLRKKIYSRYHNKNVSFAKHKMLGMPKIIIGRHRGEVLELRINDYFGWHWKKCKNSVNFHDFL